MLNIAEWYWFQALALFFVSVRVALYVNNYCERNANNQWIRNAPPLPDALHAVFPNLEAYFRCVDVPVVLGFGIGLWLLPADAWKAGFVLSSFVFLMRAVTCVSTLVPSSLSLANRAQPATLFYFSTTAHDCIYSGHSAFFAFLACFTWQYATCSWWIKVVVLVFSVLSALFVCISRLHYTVDCILAWFIVFWASLSISVTQTSSLNCFDQ